MPPRQPAGAGSALRNALHLGGGGIPGTGTRTALWVLLADGGRTWPLNPDVMQSRSAYDTPDDERTRGRALAAAGSSSHKQTNPFPSAVFRHAAAATTWASYCALQLARIG